MSRRVLYLGSAEWVARAYLQEPVEKVWHRFPTGDGSGAGVPARHAALIEARETTSPTGGRRYITFFNGLLGDHSDGSFRREPAIAIASRFVAMASLS